MSAADGGSGGTASSGITKVFWGALVVLATVFGVIAGPKILRDQHELMCDWSPGWQRFASQFGDCSAYAQKSPGPGPTAGNSDPLETLSRRGYQLNHTDFYRAISMDRKEDIDLLLKAGVKPGPLLDFVTISPEMWRFLLDRGVARDEPCEFTMPDPAAESLLTGVLYRRNEAIYRSLCQGKYAARISAFVAKAKQDASQASAHAEFIRKFERVMAAR